MAIFGVSDFSEKFQEKINELSQGFEFMHMYILMLS